MGRSTEGAYRSCHPAAYHNIEIVQALELLRSSCMMELFDYLNMSWLLLQSGKDQSVNRPCHRDQPFCDMILTNMAMLTG